MHMTPTSKSAIISQQYGLLMAQQNGTEAPSGDAWRNLASLAVLRIHKLEQDLRISANPVEASGKLIELALNHVNEQLTATERALLRYGETYVADRSAERELTDMQQRSRRAEPIALPFNARPNAQWHSTSEKMASERRRMIKAGTYSDERERELLQKYARKTPRQGDAEQKLKPTK